MNRTDRAKARALAGCRMLPDSWDVDFTRALAWLAEHDPASPLTWRQRFGLDSLVWRYRRQLAGRRDLGFELPTEQPQEEDYQPTPRRTPAQAPLFPHLGSGSPTRSAQRIDRDLPQPSHSRRQRTLF